MRLRGVLLGSTVLLVLVSLSGAPAADEAPSGFVSLFNGKDFSRWKLPEGDNGHWKIVDGVIDYDARSEAKGDKNLQSDKLYKNFILRIDWRLKTDKGYMNKVPIILPDGTHKKGEDGKEVRIEIEDVDSGIYLRDPKGKSQINIWMWPIGSGEVYGYRMDAKMPAEARAAVTPKKNMDRPRGEWNTFEIKLIGDRLWVNLNGEEVITSAQLPGNPPEGPIILQHHGGWKPRRTSGPALPVWCSSATSTSRNCRINRRGETNRLRELARLEDCGGDCHGARDVFVIMSQRQVQLAAGSAIDAMANQGVAECHCLLLVRVQ